MRRRPRHIVGHVLLGPRAPKRPSKFPDPASDCYPELDLHYVPAGSPRCVCGGKENPFKRPEVDMSQPNSPSRKDEIAKRYGYELARDAHPLTTREEPSC